MDYTNDLSLLPFERAFKLITRRADSLLLKTIGCTRREMWILLCIDNSTLSQRQIGEILGLHPNVLVKLLDGMQHRKLVERVRRKSDRREQIIKATEKGTQIQQKYLTERPTALSEIFKPLTDDQIRQWRELSLLILKNAETIAMGDDSDS
jgi:DNA-binding MarR family transcriptional regulator